MSSLCSDKAPTTLLRVELWSMFGNFFMSFSTTNFQGQVPSVSRKSGSALEFLAYSFSDHMLHVRSYYLIQFDDGGPNLHWLVETSFPLRQTDWITYQDHIHEHEMVFLARFSPFSRPLFQHFEHLGVCFEKLIHHPKREIVAIRCISSVFSDHGPQKHQQTRRNLHGKNATSFA